MDHYYRTAEEIKQISSDQNREDAGRLLRAAAAGRWQIDPNPFLKGTSALILDEEGAIWTAPIKNGEMIANLPAAGGYDYLALPMIGEGITGLAEEMDRREQREADAHWDAKDDPEGAWGGRGNNIVGGTHGR